MPIEDRTQSLSVAAAAVTSAIGIAAGPGGILIGAGLNEAAQLAIARVAEERRRRGEWVLESAGTRAELAVDQLIDRMVASADGERLLVRVILAAGNARTEERLIALAAALARAVVADDSEELGTIQAFAEVLGELTDLQAQILSAFTKTSAQLGLGPFQGDGIDPRMETLNRAQLEIVFPDLGVALLPSLATLQRLGLIEVHFPTGGATLRGGGGTANPLYTVTEFGARVVEELRAAADMLGEE